jgi:hypothetical protein
MTYNWRLSDDRAISNTELQAITDYLASCFPGNTYITGSISGGPLDFSGGRASIQVDFSEKNNIGTVNITLSRDARTLTLQKAKVPSTVLSKIIDLTKALSAYNFSLTES